MRCAAAHRESFHPAESATSTFDSACSLHLDSERERAVSSAVERHVYTVLVGGSIPSPPKLMLVLGPYDLSLAGKIASATKLWTTFSS
jgi:hypothetical protein